MQENKHESALWKDRQLMIPFLIMLTGAVLLIVAYFFPFVCATEDVLERMAAAIERSETFYERYGLTYMDSVELSLQEILRLATGVASLNVESGEVDILLFGVLFLYAPLICSILTTVGIILENTELLVTFDILSFGAYHGLACTYQELFSFLGDYEPGIAFKLYPIGAVSVLVGVIALAVTKSYLNGALAAGDYEG